MVVTIAELDVAFKNLVLLEDAEASHESCPILPKTPDEVDRLKQNRIERFCPAGGRRLSAGRRR